MREMRLRVEAAAHLCIVSLNEKGGIEPTQLVTRATQGGTLLRFYLQPACQEKNQDDNDN
jgi:hypothetical protein